MNREIKFRAWSNASKIMFEPDGEDGWDLHNGDMIEKPNTVLMQFTGLLDKSGKEIYEADILDAEKPCVVEWDEEQLCWVGNNGEWKFEFSNKGLYKIIGNVYENPNLLNK